MGGNLGVAARGAGIQGMRLFEEGYKAPNRMYQSDDSTDMLRQTYDARSMRNEAERIAAENIQELQPLLQSITNDPRSYMNALKQVNKAYLDGTGNAYKLDGNVIKELDQSGNVVSEMPAYSGLDAQRDLMQRGGGMSPFNTRDEMLGFEKFSRGMQLQAEIANSRDPIERMLLKSQLGLLGRHGRGGTGFGMPGFSGKLDPFMKGMLEKAAEDMSSDDPNVVDRALRRLQSLGYPLAGAPGAAAAPPTVASKPAAAPTPAPARQPLRNNIPDDALIHW